jgi:hypothetical protein
MQATIAALQLKQLAEMREIGMNALRDLDEERDLPIEKRPSVLQRSQAFERISKALRQIMALEQETLGLREKRLEKVHFEWGKARRDTVRHSVAHSVAVAKPELDKPKRERLLGDLFADYRNFTAGSIPDLIAGICKELGIEPDLSIWEQPSPQDVTLPVGHVWTVPANGDKPYTRIKNAAGFTTLQAYDSPHLRRHGADPPGGH